MTTQLEQGRAKSDVIYTAKMHTVGGRENGAARSSDGQLEVQLSLPGSSRPGTNPEQLFGAGWSACFESAIGIAAHRRKVTLPELTIDAEVDLPGLDRNVAQSLIEEAEHLCPHSKATAGNIDASFTLV